MNQEQSKNYYAVITAPVLYSTEISARQKLLVAMISNLSNEKGYCWASNAYFSQIMGCDERTIQRDLNLLEEKDFIYRTVHRNEDNSVNFRALSCKGVVTHMSGGDDMDVRRGHDTSVTIITNDLKTNNNKKNNKKEIEAELEEAGFELKDKFNKEHGTSFRVLSPKILKQLAILLESGYSMDNVIEASTELKKEKWLEERNFKELNLEYITRSDKMEKYYNQYIGGQKKPQGANEFVDNYLKLMGTTHE
jgi:hypothetical protein